MMGASCDNDNGSPREKMEVELPEALENFRDLSSGVLVVVANEDEERAVIRTLRAKMQRHPRSKFDFQMLGSIHRVMMRP